jgi:hypothetical protein
MPTIISEPALDVILPEPPSMAYDVLVRGERRVEDRRSVARRPGREQGMALEVIGHAVEYLIDSRMFLTEAPYTKAEQEAVQLLMTASRQVFEACAPIVPLRTRASEWLQRTFRGRKVAKFS